MTKTECHFCSTPDTRIGANHWDGTQYLAVDACESCYDAGRVASKPRKPRQPHAAATIPANDWNMLVAFSKRRG
jgi:hypothetical protein